MTIPPLYQYKSKTNDVLVAVLGHNVVHKVSNEFRDNDKAIQEGEGKFHVAVRTGNIREFSLIKVKKKGTTSKAHQMAVHIFR